MMTVVKLRDDAPELVPVAKADVEFLCHELHVGNELHRKHRSGQLRRFKVRGFQKSPERPTNQAKHNKRVHPKDRVLLREIGGGNYAVNAWYIELSTRWGLVREE
jgi:hypothetical protein